MSGRDGEGWGSGQRLPRDVSRDVDDELRFHIEERVQDNLERGLSPGHARAEAEARFGDAGAVRRELVRLGRGTGRRRWREGAADLMGDVAIAVRSLVRRPGFTAVTVLTIGLGIGAATGVYSLGHGLLLRPVPGVFEQASLVTIRVATQRSPEAAFAISHPTYEDLRRGATSLEGLVGASRVEAHVGGPESALRVGAEYVSPDFAATLGLRPALGRAPGPEDRADPHVAMISERLWHDALGGRPDVVGRRLTVNGRPFEVVGVAPRGFRGTSIFGGTDLWVPVGASPAMVPFLDEGVLSDRGQTIWLTFVGRLRPGATRESVREELQAVAGRVADEVPGALPREPLVAVETGIALSSWERGQLGGLFRVLGWMVGCLLLLSSANSANLLLSRLDERRSELAVRRALGAGGGRLARHVTTEVVVLVALGLGAGIAIAIACVELFAGERLLTFMPPMDGWRLEPAALLFALGVAVATGIAFGVAPAVRSAGGAGASGGRGSSRRGGPSRPLVVVQVALSLSLAIGAGLLLDTVRALRDIDLGFVPAAVLEASVDPGTQGYEARERERFLEGLHAEVRALPGVEAAGLAWAPIHGRIRAGGVARLEGRERDDPSAVRYSGNQVSPGFVEAAGLTLLEGRDVRSEELWTEGDGEGVAIVSASIARRIFGSGSALGRRVDVGIEEPRVLTVIGVVADARLNSVKDPTPVLLEPLGQVWSPGRASLYVRGSDIARVADGVRRVARALDPALPLYEVQPLARRVDQNLTAERVLARLGGLFAALALTLAAVGIYGVLSLTVERRRKEVGVRLALGAQAEAVRSMVVGEGMRLTAVGLALGLLVATRIVAAVGDRLWGVRPYDPLVIVGACSVLVAVALLASWAPARRALAVDPAATLRSE